MRVAIAALVALLVLHFADEQFNDARYTRATTSMFSQVARSLGIGWAERQAEAGDLMTVTSAERFLMEAERCREQAAQAISEADRSAWLQMANDWIRKKN